MKTQGYDKQKYNSKRMFCVFPNKKNTDISLHVFQLLYHGSRVGK
jgi:hypothetical protein